MNAKFKITLTNQTIELEGTEEFIERQIENIKNLLSLFSNPTDIPQPKPQTKIDNHIIEEPPKENGTGQNLSVPDNFGEWMHKFKDDVNDQEKALICAHYVQANSATNDFKTSEINNCLKEHGIKIANPSTSIQRLSGKKLTFQTRKVGKLIYMRVSKDGEAHLKTKLRIDS